MAWQIGTHWLKSTARQRPPVAAEDGQRLVAELRETAQVWRGRLAETAGGGGSPAARLAPALDQLDRDVSRKPRVAILGEFNAGKTTLTNILARTAQLETNLLANTRVATLVHHEEQVPERIVMAARTRGSGVPGGIDAQTPFEYELSAGRGALLNACSLLDTPGLSDPTHAGQVADVYARIADIAIWCSIAGHCWRESERQAWDSFSPRFRRYGVLVLTGADAVPKPEDRARILSRLERDAAGRFGVILFLAARDAAAALDPDSGEIINPKLWQQSGAAELESLVGRLVQHVADQRALRSRRWAARLLRRMSGVQGADFGPAWWLAPLMKMSEDVRVTAIAYRAHRLTRGEALAAFDGAIDRLKSAIPPRLVAIGRVADGTRVTAAIETSVREMQRVRGTSSHAALVDAITLCGIRVFNDVSQLMRGAERETATIAELEARLVGLVGKSGS